jgi:flagellar basal-body rod modification protein FlgD
MQTAAIGGTTATGQRDNDAFGAMRSEDFFELLVSELQNQDPFNPNETSDMINQVSQIRSIELSSNLTSALDKMTAQQRNTGSAELIGKYVQGVLPDADGSPVPIGGVVTGVNYGGDGTVVLELDTGQQMPLSIVEHVTTPEQAGVVQDAAEAAANAARDAAAANAAKSNAAARPAWFTLDSQIRL